MSLTGTQLLLAFSQFIDDSFVSTSTSAGTTSTVVDTTLQRFGEKANEEAFVRLTEDSGTPGNIYLVRRVTGFTGNTLTVAPVFPQAVETGKDYELHRWDPAKKFRALDRARILAFPQVANIVVNETLTSDGYSTELTIPSAIRRGPSQVWAEQPLSPSISWNLLTNPNLTSTTAWTLSSSTGATYTRTVNDHVVPKLEPSCVKLTSSGATGYIAQAMSAAIAAAMAGRRVSGGAWVYSRTAGSLVRIVDDSGTLASSTAHAGGGWEFLQVSGNVTGTNATTLEFRILPVTNNAVFVERAFFGQVDRISLDYKTLVPRDGIHRDDDDAKLYLKAPAPRGYQYRLVGRTPITALGTDITSQTTNTMEVSEADQDLLLATAARILFTWEGMSSGEIDKTFPMIAVVESRFKELQEDWKRRYPRAGYIDTWASDR